MKLTLIALLMMSCPAFASESAENKICDSFQAKVDLECAHIMCDDYIKDRTYKNLKDCTSADDYAEAAQSACEDQATTVEGLVKKYNLRHPNSKIKCE